MPVLGDNKVIREYRIWIYQNMIFLAFASVEFEQYLLSRPVLAAKKASASGDILLAQLRCRRNHSGRIELQLYCQSSYLHLTYPDILQCTKIIACKRPA